MAKDVLDRYRVIAQLGRGGMADVYLAATQGPAGFAKLLVLKILDPSLARDSQFLAMFRDEARLAARLNHPNIVQTYEVGEADGRHFIAMEYLEGQPLHRIVDAFRPRGGLPVGAALRIAIDALSGLHSAHELRGFDGQPLAVVHRDITPQNLFVTYEGQAKIVDFGIAKAFDSTTQTMVGTVKGKVGYMAPEQARGEAVDRRADVFSLAVVLWELLAGRRLWEGLTDVAVVGRLVHGDLPGLSTTGKALPAGLAALVMRGLSPDPDKRPQTAAEFGLLLEEVEEGLSRRVSSRRLGEAIAKEFASERAHVRSVVQKQLDRLGRDSQPGSSRTPASSSGTSRGAGDMPILGEGSRVHDAVTALHTGTTGTGLSRTDSGSLGVRGPSSTGAVAAGTLTTSVTDAHIIAQNRAILWIALGAVGVAGLSIGVAAPWRALRDPEPAAAANVAGEPAPVALAARTPLPAQNCDTPNKPLVELSGEIREDAVLTCDKDYLLRFTTFVSAGATLRIDPGTRLLGDRETKGTLVVQPGGRIHAVGTREAPIVFTSDRPEGQRAAGDWGGVLLLGEAPVNLKNAQGQPMPGRVEGIASGGEYGGNQPDDSSGTLSFVRIEYSGTELGPNNEINGLTLAGVGRGTVIDHVMVRQTADDCFEFFGGTVDAKYLVCQHADDDAFDWDLGYTGRLQFLVAQAHPRASDGSNGLEGDNDPNGSRNEPISRPLVYNATLCGKNRRMEAEEHYAVLLRRGSAGRIRNGLFVGFGAGLDVRDVGTEPNIAASTFFGNLVYEFAYPERPDAPRSDRLSFDDDLGFDEAVYLENPGLRIARDDPKIGNCFDARSPGMKPLEPLTANGAVPPDDGFFDVSATFVGAFRDRSDAWDAGRWVVWGE